MPHSACTELDPGARRALLALARGAIASGLGVAAADANAETDRLPAVRRGVFVTLQKCGGLRGCIGVTETDRVVAEAVIECARGAAFRDPRFPALTRRELVEVTISISVLSKPEPLTAASRAELLAQLQAGVDGLILAEGPRRATYLPQVWEQLPETEAFLSQLLIKAGLPGDYWSPELRFLRYRSESFTESQRRNPGPSGRR